MGRNDYEKIGMRKTLVRSYSAHGGICNAVPGEGGEEIGWRGEVCYWGDGRGREEESAPSGRNITRSGGSYGHERGPPSVAKGKVERDKEKHARED